MGHWDANFLLASCLWSTNLGYGLDPILSWLDGIYSGFKSHWLLHQNVPVSNDLTPHTSDQLIPL